MLFQHLISICSQLTPAESLANKMGEINKQLNSRWHQAPQLHVGDQIVLFITPPAIPISADGSHHYWSFCSMADVAHTHTLRKLCLLFPIPHWFCLLFVSWHWEAFFNAWSVPNFSIKWVIISYGLLKDKRAFVHLFLQGKSPLPPFSCCTRIRKCFWKTI